MKMKNLNDRPSTGGNKARQAGADKANEPRRDFLKFATLAGAGLVIVKPESVYGSRANSTLQLGIIGSGGRGTTMGTEFVRNTETRVAALADLFDDRLQTARQRFDKQAEEKGLAKLADAQIFRGPRAFEQLLQSPVDVVLISSPPYFHPEHFEAAVAAGKHTYLEKPVATDNFGCKRVLKAGDRVQGKFSVHVGFQVRYAPPFREVVQRLRDGQIGDVVCIQSYYYSGDLGRQAKPGMSPVEARVRNWVFDKMLSGDILVEQNIHIIDVCNWLLQSHPLKASGTGGRKARTDVGDVWDHYLTTFYYPNDVQVSFNSTQFAKGWSSMGVRVFGTKGTAEAHYRSGVRIFGANPWDAGVENSLEQAIPEKVKAFVASIQSGKFENQVAQGTESTLSAILGRTAAYKGQELSWDKVAKSDTKWDTKLDLASLAANGQP
jgi:myo-inositol 2-dehydrogenase / D-chiro-inositol 1-dehydrogenase